MSIPKPVPSCVGCESCVKKDNTQVEHDTSLHSSWHFTLHTAHMVRLSVRYHHGREPIARALVSAAFLSAS